MNTLDTLAPEPSRQLESDLPELRLDKRVALITGAASGIGKATARLLGGRGAALALFDQDKARLEELAGGLGNEGVRAFAISGSATRTQDCDAAARSCAEKFGRIDILVNCVGGSSIPTMPLWKVSDEQWSFMMDLNLKSAFNFCRSVIPLMLEGGYGRIVNIASTAGKEGNPLTATYCTAKAGLIGMTKSLGKELATSGILVNAVAPAVIDTEATLAGDMSDEFRAHLERLRAKIPMARTGRAEEVARLIAFLASEHLSFSTGSVYDISGGRATY